jgi:signal transduction histidine kinase
MASDATKPGAEDAAWNEYAALRERATFTTANLLICTLVPVWSAFDFYLEPARALRFAMLRLGDVALTLAIWRFLARSRDLTRNRRAMSAAVVGVGATIAVMLPQVPAHYLLYTFGFSLVFWGSGLLLIWPLAWTIATFGAIVAADVVAHAAIPNAIPRADLVGSLFYVGSAAVISAAQVRARRRLEREAWAAAHALKERNEELAGAVSAQSAVQARLTAASTILAESLDWEATGARVAELAVPAFASWAALVATGPNGAIVRVAEHVDPERREALREAVARMPAPRREKPTHAERVGETTGKDVARVAAVAVAGKIRPGSLILAPLVTRGERTGTLVLGRVDRPYEHDEIAFAEELAHRAALALENARLYREAEDAVRIRDEFLSIASHELRTPLNPLGLALDSLLRATTDARATEQLTLARRQVTRLTTLVNQLLDVSRLTAGRLVLEREELDLAEVVRDAAHRFEGEASKAGSTLEVAPNGEIRGAWDRLRIDQIVSNLVSNAIKYGRGKPIRVSVGTKGDRAEVRVADEGIGIARAEQARIFERFERAVSARNYGGLGLGLWIVSLLVEAMGGAIRVESEVDKGSVFVVELPIVTSA